MGALSLLAMGGVGWEGGVDSITLRFGILLEVCGLIVCSLLEILWWASVLLCPRRLFFVPAQSVAGEASFAATRVCL